MDSIIVKSEPLDYQEDFVATDEPIDGYGQSHSIDQEIKLEASLHDSLPVNALPLPTNILSRDEEEPPAQALAPTDVDGVEGDSSVDSRWNDDDACGFRHSSKSF